MKDDRSPACDSKTHCPLCLHFSLPTGPGRLLTVLHGGCLGNYALIAVKLCTRSYRSLRSFSPICLWMWLHMSIEVLIKSPHAVYFLHFKTCSNTLLLHQYEFSSLEAGRSDWIAADRDSWMLEGQMFWCEMFGVLMVAYKSHNGSVDQCMFPLVSHGWFESVSLVFGLCGVFKCVWFPCVLGSLFISSCKCFKFEVSFYPFKWSSTTTDTLASVWLQAQSSTKRDACVLAIFFPIDFVIFSPSADVVYNANGLATICECVGLNVMWSDALLPTAHFYLSKCLCHWSTRDGSKINGAVFLPSMYVPT